MTQVRAQNTKKIDQKSPTTFIIFIIRDNVKSAASFILNLKIEMFNNLLWLLSIYFTGSARAPRVIIKTSKHLKTFKKNQTPDF